jgi:predicted aminopeptidase
MECLLCKHKALGSFNLSPTKKKKKGKTGRRVPPPKTSHYVYANISKPEKISEILLVPSISDKGCTHCTLIYFRMG